MFCPLPSLYKDTPNHLMPLASRQTPCAQSLFLWAVVGLGPPKGVLTHGRKTRQQQVCVTTMLLLAAPAAWVVAHLTFVIHPKMLLLEDPQGPGSPPICTFSIDSGSLHKNNLGQQKDSQHPWVLFVPGQGCRDGAALQPSFDNLENTQNSNEIPGHHRGQSG